jgi:hypothetical protein
MRCQVKSTTDSPLTELSGVSAALQKADNIRIAP